MNIEPVPALSHDQPQRVCDSTVDVPPSSGVEAGRTAEITCVIQ